MIFWKKHRIIRSLRIVFFDFDGVFTDNHVIIDESGKESVVCSRSDGYGLDLLRPLGIEAFVLSSESNSVVGKRMQKLQVSFIQGCKNKLAEMNKLLKKKGISSSYAAFVGNDVNDLECMKAVGLSVAVGDAYPQVKRVAQWILRNTGGHGVVREFCERVYRIRRQGV